MAETIYEGFEKMAKKQNKEQVPPAPEPQQKKPKESKPAKKSLINDSPKPNRYRNLEEAIRGVSTSPTYTDRQTDRQTG